MKVVIESAYANISLCICNVMESMMTGLPFLSLPQMRMMRPLVDVVTAAQRRETSARYFDLRRFSRPYIG